MIESFRQSITSGNCRLLVVKNGMNTSSTGNTGADLSRAEHVLKRDVVNPKEAAQFLRLSFVFQTCGLHILLVPHCKGDVSELQNTR